MALQAWGKEAQVVVAIVEMGELLAELADEWMGRATDVKLQDKTADVLFCAVQLAVVYGASDVATVLLGKVTRTRIKAEASIGAGRAAP